MNSQIDLLNIIQTKIRRDSQYLPPIKSLTKFGLPGLIALAGLVESAGLLNATLLLPSSVTTLGCGIPIVPITDCPTEEDGIGVDGSVLICTGELCFNPCVVV